MRKIIYYDPKHFIHPKHKLEFKPGQEYIIITDSKHVLGYDFKGFVIITQVIKTDTGNIEWHIEAVDRDNIPKLNECKSLKEFYTYKTSTGRIYKNDSTFYIKSRDNPIYLKDLENLLDKQSDFTLSYTLLYDGPQLKGNYNCEMCRWFNEHLDNWKVSSSISGYIVSLSFHYSKTAEIMNNL